MKFQFASCLILLGTYQNDQLPAFPNFTCIPIPMGRFINVFREVSTLTLKPSIKMLGKVANDHDGGFEKNNLLNAFRIGSFPGPEMAKKDCGLELKINWPGTFPIFLTHCWA